KMAGSMRAVTMFAAGVFVLSGGLMACIGGVPPRPQAGAQGTAEGMQGRPNVAVQCLATAKTQLEINTWAARRGDEADAELNRVFRRVVERHAENQAFLEKMKAAG